MNRRTSISRPVRARGFTLLELVVALALLAVMLSLLFGGLRLGTRVWNAVEQRTVTLHDNQLAAHFILRQIEQARPVFLRDSSGAPAAGFAGNPTALQFVAPLASRAGAGGLYRLSLDVVNTGEQTRRLELSYTLFQTEQWEAYGASDAPRTVVLYQTLSEVEFSYFGSPAPKTPARWLSTWQDPENLPRLVRLRLRLGGGGETWRELIAAPKVNAPLDTGRTPVTRHGRELKI